MIAASPSCCHHDAKPHKLPAEAARRSRRGRRVIWRGMAWTSEGTTCFSAKPLRIVPVSSKQRGSNWPADEVRTKCAKSAQARGLQAPCGRTAVRITRCVQREWGHCQVLTTDVAHDLRRHKPACIHGILVRASRNQRFRSPLRPEGSLFQHARTPLLPCAHGARVERRKTTAPSIFV
jgi:hypothetical protein